MSNKSFTNYLILRLLSPFIIFFIFTAVVSFFDSISSNWNNNSSQIIEADNEEVISKFSQEKEFLKSVFWKTNYDQSHAGVYRIQSSDYYSSLRNRSSISIYSDWNAMAKKVINNDYDKLNSVYTMLQRIRTNNNYDKYEFADAIVSFVPYPSDLISPSNNSILNGKTNTKLVWDGSHPDGEISEYQVYFGTDSNPNYFGTTTFENMDVSIQSGSLYFWKVIAIDTNGNSSSSPVYVFQAE